MMAESHTAAAYGGPGWSPRTASLSQEIGTIWLECGVSSEWSTLKSVLLHQPGLELSEIREPDNSQMLRSLDADLARQQHDALASTFLACGISVHYIEPRQMPPPNLMFVADLLFMTPEGALLGRPASTVRAGEERFVARRLAELGIPILRTVRGSGTFEGADAAWIDSQTVLLATGLRTNVEGAGRSNPCCRRWASRLSRLGCRTERCTSWANCDSPIATWPLPGRAGCLMPQSRRCAPVVTRCYSCLTRARP